MTQHRLVALTLTISLVSSLASLSASAATFSLIDYPGATLTYPNAISSGTVAGTYYDASGNGHGFTFDGSYHNFDHPLAVNGTRINGISGVNFVGSYFDASNVRHAYEYNSATMVSTSINVPTSAPGTTIIADISGSNLVGEYEDTSGNTHGFLYDGSSYTTLSHPSSPDYSGAVGTDGTKTVGYFDNAGLITGYLYDGVSYSTILPPGADASMVFGGAVDGSTIVGDQFTTADSGIHGFVYDGSTYQTLDYPSSSAVYNVLTDVEGNQILGFYWSNTEGTEGKGFLAIVPEPSTWVLATMGLTSAAVVSCRRRFWSHNRASALDG